MVKDVSDNAKEQSDMPDILYDPGRRFPYISSPDGFDQLTYLSDEEKSIGKEILHRANPAKVEGVEQPPEHAAIQRRNPWTIYHSDPELMAAELDYEETHYRLLIGLRMTTDENIMMATDKDGFNTNDAELQRRYGNSILIVQKVAHEYKDEWTLRLMATFPGSPLSAQQFALLGQSKSVVWNEEQRLVLEFTEGVIRRNLSDELHARAEDRWGRKQTLRYAAQATLYVGMLMFDYINVSDAERLGRLQSD